MTLHAGPSFLTLLRRVRRRLWRRRAIGLLARGLWGSAAMILASGLAHLTGIDLAWQIVMAGALAPTAAAFGWSAFNRPPLTAAAAAADLDFGTRDLFISAWDQVRRPQSRKPGACGLVLDQAEHAAARALRAPPAGGFPFRPARMLVPMAMAATGVFLLLLSTDPNVFPAWRIERAAQGLPGIEPAGRSPSPLLIALQNDISGLIGQPKDASRLDEGREGNGQSGYASALDAAAFVNAPAGSAATDPSEPHGAETAKAAHAVPNGELAANEDRASTPPPERATPRHDTGLGGVPSGDAAGTGAAIAPSDGRATHRVELSAGYADMIRPEDGSGQSTKAMPLAGDVVAPPGQPGGPPRPAPPARATAWHGSDLGPVVTNYTRRYFEEIENLP